jgi:hypothetical protein
MKSDISRLDPLRHEIEKGGVNYDCCVRFGTNQRYRPW